MPRDSQLKQDARLQPSARTAVDLKPERLDVVSKATDPFVQQGKDADLTGAVDVLKMVSGGLDSFSTMQKAQKEDNEIKARADVDKGVYDKPDGILNLGVGYSEKWKTLNAEASMAKASSDVKTILKNNNFFINSADPAAERKKVIDEAYKNAGIDTNDPYAMTGASAEYHALLQYDRDGYSDAFVKKTRETHVNDVNTRTGTLVDNYLRKSLEENKDINTREFRDLLGTIRTAIDPNIVPPSQQGSVIVNAVLQHTERKVKELIAEDRLDEAEQMKEDVINTLRQPETGSGVNWSTLLDANGKPVAQDMIDTTENQLTMAINKAEQKIEMDNQKTYQENGSFFINEMLRTRDRGKLMEYFSVLEKAKSDNYLDDNNVAHTTEILKRLLDNDANVIEDPNKVFAFKANVYAGRAKISDVGKAVSEGIITRKTAEEALGIIERIKARQDSLAAEGRSKEFLTWQNLYNQNHNNLMLRYKDLDPGTREAVEAYYNSEVHDKGLSPVVAYQNVIKTFKDGASISSRYPDAASAKVAYLDAKNKYSKKLISKKDYDDVVANAKVWMTLSSYSSDLLAPPPPPKKK